MVKTHSEYLASQLKDRAFAEGFHREKAKLRIAYDIHATRVRLGLSQSDLAQKAGITQQMVSRVENAAQANMSHRTLSRIAEALGMDVGLVSRRDA